ncbi:alpha/beta fold hydrolase [Actinoplanes sp. CA-030573]|uniref:alpha/beta fold hydrolase n=1 Tax=Actinoplanes sp. CA-030573 TaxID=3239898 RepID=UPI003D8C0860
MATFVMIHGAGDVGWYWHLVEADLRDRGHTTSAPDLPCDDDAAGLVEYADVVAAAIGALSAPGPPIVVAQSLGGFVAPLVCDRVPVAQLVLVAPMIPAPGEAPADYWADTGYDHEAEGDLFYQDVPAELAAEAMKRSRRQSETRLSEPSPLAAWPAVPTRVIACRDDRLLPLPYLRRVSRERLGITPEEIDGGHTPALSHPRELAALLHSYAVAESGA